MTDAQLIGALLKDRNIVLKGGDIISTGGGFRRCPILFLSPRRSVLARSWPMRCFWNTRGIYELNLTARKRPH